MFSSKYSMLTAITAYTMYIGAKGLVRPVLQYVLYNTVAVKSKGLGHFCFFHLKGKQNNQFFLFNFLAISTVEEKFPQKVLSF